MRFLQQYKAALVVISAGAFGIGLLCSISIIAIWDPQQTVSKAGEPLNLMDVAIDNLATAALSNQAVEFLSTPASTTMPTLTVISATPTYVPSNTPIVGMSPVFTNSTDTSDVQWKKLKHLIFQGIAFLLPKAPR